MMRRLRWSTGPRPLPKRPYRDTALVYLALAVLIAVFAAVTGGGLVRGVVYAGLFWVVATSYGFVNWRRRLARARREEEQQT